MELKAIALIGDELALAWEDGREQYFSLSLLRDACPCALCQGEPDVMGKTILPLKHSNLGAGVTTQKYQLSSYQKVGGYGVQLNWADGHRTGIYSYHYLRELES